MEAPLERPEETQVIMKIIGPVLPTEASALALTKLPTIIVSIIL